MWKPTKEQEELISELHRLRCSLSVFKMCSYKWMHQPAMKLIRARIKEIEAVLGIVRE